MGEPEEETALIAEPPTKETVQSRSEGASVNLDGRDLLDQVRAAKSHPKTLCFIVVAVPSAFRGSLKLIG